MTDIVNMQTRSKMMSNIKSVSQIENIINKELWRRGIRARRNTSKLFGKPDWSIKKYKVVIFLDSCFWHHCPVHGKIPNTNREFWERKLKRNVERDLEVTLYYQNIGWNILRIWEHEVKENFEQTIDRMVRFIIVSKEMHRIKN